MGNNIKEELNKIPLPPHLHERSQLGILKAKEEMGEIKQEYTKKNNSRFYLVASLLLPLLIYGSMVLYDQGVKQEDITTASSHPAVASSIPKASPYPGNQYEMRRMLDIADVSMSAHFIFSGKVIEMTTFQKQGETLIKIKVDLAQTYRGLLKKGNLITFVANSQTLKNQSIRINETYLFCGIYPSDSQLYTKEVGGEYYFLLSALQGSEAEKVVKELEK